MDVFTEVLVDEKLMLFVGLQRREEVHSLASNSRADLMRVLKLNRRSHCRERLAAKKSSDGQGCVASCRINFWKALNPLLRSQQVDDCEIVALSLKPLKFLRCVLLLNVLQQVAAVVQPFVPTTWYLAFAHLLAFLVVSEDIKVPVPSAEVSVRGWL